MSSAKSAFWVHHPVLDQSAAAFADATLAFHREVGGDFLKITPSGTWMTVGHGAVDEVWPDDVIGRRRVTSSSLGAWRDMRRWTLDTMPESVAVQLEATQRIVEGAGDTPVVATLFNPFTQAFQLAGPKRFAADRLTPDFNEGLAIITDNTRLVLEAMIDRGIAGLYLATHLMQPALCPPDEYVAGASDAALLNAAVAAGLGPVIFHLHGPAVTPTLSPDLAPEVILHLESGAAEVTDRPVWTGVPLAELRTCQTRADLDALREKHHVAPEAPLTAGCCVTLDVPRAEIATWNHL
jgi:hypothetical protein